MNCVDFVLDCHSHITSHASQVFASFTHYTSYSLLNNVHASVCVLGPTNQVWKLSWDLCTTYLLLEKINLEENWNLCLREVGLKFWVFENAFHLILMHFAFIVQKLWGVVSKLGLQIFKTVFFPKIQCASAHFDRSNLIFDRSKKCLRMC